MGDRGVKTNRERRGPTKFKIVVLGNSGMSRLCDMMSVVGRKICRSTAYIYIYM